MPGGFKRISYNGTEEIFELKIFDGTGREMGRWRNMKSDFIKTLKMVNRKYDLNLVIRERRMRNENEDLDWARH